MERYLSPIYCCIYYFKVSPLFLHLLYLLTPQKDNVSVEFIKLSRVVKCIHGSTWNKARALSQYIYCLHTGHQKAGLVLLNWLLDHVSIVHKHESLFMVVYYLWPWISLICLPKAMSPVINNDCRKQKHNYIDFPLFNVFTNLRRNMTLIVLRIKTFFFILLIMEVRKDCKQSPKELSEAPDYNCLSWRRGPVRQV